MAKADFAMFGLQVHFFRESFSRGCTILDSNYNTLIVNTKEQVHPSKNGALFLRGGTLFIIC